MKKQTRFDLLLFFCLLSVGLFANPIKYEISPVVHFNQPQLHVNMVIMGDADGETEFAMPNAFGVTQKLFRCIKKIECLSKSTTVYMDTDTLFFRIYHAPGQELRLSYDLVQDVPKHFLVSQNAFRPIIQPEYFHVFGNCLFLLPNGWNDYDVTLNWKSFPKNYTLHNSYGTREQQQRFYAESAKWLESVFVGGDFRILETKVSQKPVYLAIRGTQWSFGDTELLEMLNQTVSVQRSFWNDFEIPYYTVTLVPFDLIANETDRGLASIKYLGAGLSNSFAAFATPSNNLKVNGLYHLFNHEMMHDWIGNKIRNGGNINDMRLAWFSEGFTEYFAYKNMLAAGFINNDEYLDILNKEFFAQLYTDSLAESPNWLVQQDFFNNPGMREIPYKRGCILAFYLDNAIKVKTGNQIDLHHFLLEMLDYYYENDKNLTDNFDFFSKNLSRYFNGSQIEKIMKNHVEDGKLFKAQEFVLPSYFSITLDRRKIPVLKLNKEVDNWAENLSK